MYYKALSHTKRFAAILAALVICIAIPLPAQADPPQKIDKQTALLIIDVQEFYYPGGAVPLVNPEAASQNINKLIEKFRNENRTIIHVGHKISKGSSFHADVMPIEGEKVIMKSEVSAFNGTDLLGYVQQKDIKRLVICGMQTHMCVEGAVRAAYDLGLECILVRDACATRALTYQGKTIDADEVHASTLSSLDRSYATVIDTESFLKTY
jgi:nicotinamidase-related amidase